MSSINSANMRTVRVGIGENDMACGELIDLPDGMETTDYGVALREVCTGDNAWSSSTWISKEGVCYQKHFNPYRLAFEWHGPKSVGERNGELYVSVGAVGRAKQIRLVRALALAFVSCPRVTFSDLHAALLFDGGFRAKSVGWIVAGTAHNHLQPTPSTTLDASHTSQPLSTEEWAPLQYTWFDVSGEPVEHFSTEVYGAYHVSSRGWVRSPQGRCSRGARTPSGRHWHPIAGGVHIWIDEAVLRSFTSQPRRPHHVVHKRHGLESSDVEILEWGEAVNFVAPAVQRVAEAIAISTTLEDAAMRLQMTAPRMWNLIIEACRTLSLPQLQWTKKVAHPAVATVVEQQAATTPLLAKLREAVDREMGTSRTWSAMSECDRFGMVSAISVLSMRRRLASRVLARM